MSLDRVASNSWTPIAEALGERRIPGAVLGVVDAAGSRSVRCDGFAQIEPSRVAMTRETIFDLASLTKVLFTTTTILKLAEAGKLSLDQPLADLIPDLRQYDPKAPERALTIRQCLTHQTFLPNVEPLYTYAHDPQTLRAFVLQRVWKHGPPVYSDINFILLGIIIERVTGRPLGQQPLRAGFTFTPDPSRCAATERCTWRGRVMRGEVHDENAYALGGPSGHAGLFGGVDAVLDFARAMLDGSLMKPESITLLHRREAPQRTLGWEMKYDTWSGGPTCSDDTIGHTGFTGVGLWIDFPRGLAWTLLTNRVHPSRHVDTGIIPLRRMVGERVIAAFDATKA
jgi:CubicO group peptidase (beta-lactamase class C family)